MHNGAPCQRLKLVSKYLRKIKVKILDWAGNSLDLNPIKNLLNCMKNKVAKKQPFSAEELVTPIKEAWVKEISTEYCALHLQ